MKLKKLYRRYLRYPLWRVRHPFAPYESYYAWVVTRKLRRGRAHPAIGPTAKAARGEREMIKVLQQHGLQPHHAFVDYGCGSLRLGRPIIELLEPGKFWGVDLAQEFLDAGLDYVGAELAAQKRPNLRVIDEAGLAAAKAARPDFIGAWHVCGKIPDQILDGFFAKAARPDFIGAWHVCGKIPDQILDGFFAKVLGLMHAGTHVFLQFEDTGKREQLHGLAWSLPEPMVIAAIKRVDPKLRVDILELTKRRHRNMRYLCAHVRY